MSPKSKGVGQGDPYLSLDNTVLGIIENMSTHICSECGYEESIFGSGGGDFVLNANPL